MRPLELRLGDLRIEGWSVAGQETWFRVHPPGIAFDTGRGASQLAGAHDLFLSHGHLDHALGLPWVLSQRSRYAPQGHLETRVFCPRPIADSLEALIAAAASLEGGEAFRCEIVPLAIGDRVDVGKGFLVEAFATDHVVPSLGYHLIHRKRRLPAALAGRSGPELVALREQGVDTAEIVEEPWLSYCGDTSQAVFDLSPAIFDSRVLLLECTFLGPGRSGERDLYKHLHLEDIAEHAERFHNTAIVLHHLSRRHRADELRNEIARLMPADLRPRIHLMVEESA
jgi:ribonuclease Z